MAEEAKIYESDSAFVINKSPGTLSTEIDELICHRLDRETSGCLIVAKDKKAKKQIQKQFKERSVKKYYLAFVLREFNQKRQVLEDWLERDPKNSNLMRVAPGFTKKSNGKELVKDKGKNKRFAKTIIRLKQVFRKGIFKKSREEFNYFSLLEAQPITGRRNQIRVQLSSIDHPILGDSWYGSKILKKANNRLEVVNLMLHAKKIDFYDPAKKSRVEVESERPERFNELIKKLNG